MMNPFKEVNWSPGPEDCRKFARSLIIGFPCLAVLWMVAAHLAGKGWHFPAYGKFAGIGVLAGVVFLVWPSFAKPFYLAWYALACCIGLVVGNVLLSITFYVLVTGIGLMKRFFGSQPIRKKMDKQAKTYWQDAKQPADLESYYRQS